MLGVSYIQGHSHIKACLHILWSALLYGRNNLYEGFWGFEEAAAETVINFLE